MLFYAAVQFGDPLMLVGLLAAGIPIILHLLNKIRSPIVPFPTLRFLKITAQKTSRRRQLQQWFLLLLRMIVFALIAMAIASPFIRGGSSGLAYTFILMMLIGMALLALGATLLTTTRSRAKMDEEPERDAAATQAPIPAGPKRFVLPLLLLLGGLLAGGWSLFGLTSNRYFSAETGGYTGRATAAVLLVDNSHSMLARQDSLSRLQRAKEFCRQLLAETIRPAEAAVVLTNSGAQAAPDTMTTDMTALLGQLDRAQPTGVATPMREAIRHATDLLNQSNQPNKMLVIVSDMARQNFANPEVFSALKNIPDPKGFLAVLMPVGVGLPQDAGIADFTVAGGQTVVGSEMTLDVQVINNSDSGDVKDIQLLVDDQPIPGQKPRVQLGAAGTGSARAAIRIPYRPTTPGFHRITAQLAATSDAAEWNNQRSLVLNISRQVNVLVIGSDANVRARSPAFFTMAALDPYSGSRENGRPWSVVPRYASAQAAMSVNLSQQAAVFLCDVRQVPPALADSLAQYVTNGGRLITILGPSVDSANYNQVLGARKILPAMLNQPVTTAAGSPADWVDVTTDIFANLFDTQEPFRDIVVTGRWSLAGNMPERGRILSKLADGGTLITQHNMGSGIVYTLLTAPSATWCNMATTRPFLPMLNRMALGDFGRSGSSTTLLPGATVELPIAGDDLRLSADVTSPSRKVLNVRADREAGKPRWFTSQTYEEGLYTWATLDRRQSGQFVINPPAEEVELLPADVNGLSREMKVTSVVASTPAELITHLEKQAEGTSLTPGILAFVLILAVAETLLANRQRPALRMAGEIPGIRNETTTRTAA